MSNWDDCFLVLDGERAVSLKHFLYPIYHGVTAPWRHAIAKQCDRESFWPAVVLFYHRIDDSQPNDWTITNAAFDRHIELLARQTNVVGLKELQVGQEGGSRSSLQVAITFDDGYESSWLNAIPKILERKWPITYFVSTLYAETLDPFPHDLARGTYHRPTSIRQLQEMAAAGVEIGCHTHSHIDLGLPHSRATLEREIIDSRKRLQDWTGQSVRYFSFPYGMPKNMSQAAVDIVYEAGFEGFCSAYGALNWADGDGFHLQRIHASDHVASLKNWLSLDPRKVFDARRFIYIDPRNPGRRFNDLKQKLAREPLPEPAKDESDRQVLNYT